MECQYQPFHLAIPTNDLEKSKKFYGEVLQCQQGRIDPSKWIDYNFFGHQVVAHFTAKDYQPKTYVVDNIPIPNFGVYLTVDQYNEVKERFDSHKIGYRIIEEKESKKEFMHVKDFTGNNLLMYCKN